MIGKETGAFIRFPKLIASGMVLQRNSMVKLWGQAVPGSVVTLDFVGKQYHAEVDEAGNWIMYLPTGEAGGPYELLFRTLGSRGRSETSPEISEETSGETSSGETARVILEDVWVGEVWLCSGQSNMELTLARVYDQYSELLGGYNNSWIRQFSTTVTYDFTGPQADLPTGSWQAVSEENLLTFSATAFFFAKELYEELKVPIGIINASLGGSPVEAWMSDQALQEFPQYIKRAKEFEDPKKMEQLIAAADAQVASWHAKLDQQDLGLQEDPPWFSPNVDTDTWDKIVVPSNFEDHGFLEFSGVMWFAKTFNLPAFLGEKQCRVQLGTIVDSDEVYINGHLVGTTTYRYPPRKYPVPIHLLKGGENTIVMRVKAHNGDGGFVSGKPYCLEVGAGIIPLDGYWRCRVGAEAEPAPQGFFPQREPIGLYNGTIAPIVGYTIRGTAWYQGESNTARSSEYRALFAALIRDWRHKWGQGDFPFLYVQLPNFGPPTNHSTESDWARLRQAQLDSLVIPETGMAVTIDVGEWNDLHPVHKKDVGKRLSLLAKGMVYQRELPEISGPIVQQAATIEGSNKVRVIFSHVATGLTVSGETESVNQLTIAGENRQFFQAQGRLEGDQLAVCADQVAKPKYVRYAWADNPQSANLYNNAGLPASPFEVMVEYKPNSHS